MQPSLAESVYAAGAARAAGLGLGSGALELGLWGPCHSISYYNHVQFQINV